MPRVKKIISGGQTGVDQAALQVAINTGIDHGGWCPPGRVCENGLIPEQFKLKETPKERDASAPDVPRSQRTIWNVRDADGVLIFCESTKLQSDRGTKLAFETSLKLGKPYLVMNINEQQDFNKIRNWILDFEIRVLSIGGPSEETSLGIYEKAYSILMKILSITNDE